MARNKRSEAAHRGRLPFGWAVWGGVLCFIASVASGGEPKWPDPVPGAPPPACRYEVTVIEGGPLCGGSPVSTYATAINENGDVAGDAYCNPVARRPFFWSPPPGVGFELPAAPPGLSDSPLAAMNNQREIVGTGMSPITRAFFRDANGQYSIIEPLPGGAQTWGNGVNDAGQVVGYWGTPSAGAFWHAYIWQDGTMTSLGPLAGPIGRAFDINSVGQITGWTGTAQTGPAADGRAFILHKGELTILPVIPGGTASQGDAINEIGEVVGTGWFVPPIRHACLWVNGQAYDLGTLAKFSTSIGLDLNNHRIVVGSSTRAFIWQDGLMRDLNDLIPPQPQYTLKSARSINDDGIIAVSGSLGGSSGPSRGFILTPIFPAPADLDGSCSVNGLDLGILLSNWSIPPSTPGCHGDSPCLADLNGDGLVNGFDLGILLSQWTIP